MKTATLYKCNGAYCWNSNYPMGGYDLVKTVEQTRKVKSEPFIPLGRHTLEQRQEHALDFFSEYVNERGYETREQAFHGARMKKPDNGKNKEKQSFIEKLLSFFIDYEGV